PQPARAHPRRRQVPPGPQRDRARQRLRDRSGGAGRLRRQRGLPVPDRREWRQVVSEIITSAAPATRAGLPWGQWWIQLRAIVRLELRKGFRRSFGLLLLALAPLFILVLRLVVPRAIQDSADIPGATQFF